MSAGFPSPSPNRPARIDRLLSLMLLCTVVCVYLPAIGFDFVNWDDPWYITGNELIRSWHPRNLWRISTEVVARNYAPITQFSYLLDHTLWGDWPGGYHLTNFLLHGFNAVLVYALVARLAGSRFVGWGTALLFAVHPVHVESVAWVSSRKGLLSASFLLASLWYWLRPDRTERHEWRGILFFILALLTKAIAVVMPPLVLAYDMLVLRRKFADAFPRQVIPGFLALWLLLVTMSAQSTDIGGVRDHLSLSKPHLLAVDAIIVWRYLGMLVWPGGLAILYDPPTAGIAASAALAITAWMIVAVFIWRIRRNAPRLALAAAAFWLFLLPVLNLFPITTLMNDRYLYLPSIPAFAVAIALIRYPHTAAALLRNGCAAIEYRTAPAPAPGRFHATLGCLIVLLLTGFYANGSRDRLGVWRDGLSLWTETRQQVPQLPVVQIQYANTLQALGQTRLALEVLHDALSQARLDDADRRRIEAKLRDWQSTEAGR